MALFLSASTTPALLTPCRGRNLQFFHNWLRYKWSAHITKTTLVQIKMLRVCIPKIAILLRIKYNAQNKFEELTS